MQYGQIERLPAVQPKQKDKPLRPGFHDLSAEQAIKAIWRGLIPTIEQRLARGRKAEAQPFTSQDYGVRLSHTVEEA